VEGGHVSESPEASGNAAIVCDPAIHGGEPVIAGTSTPVRAVAELWRQGMPAEEIPLHLPHLTLAQVFQALGYYLTHRDEIERYIQANRIPESWAGRPFDPNAEREDRRGG